MSSASDRSRREHGIVRPDLLAREQHLHGITCFGAGAVEEPVDPFGMPKDQPCSFHRRHRCRPIRPAQENIHSAPWCERQPRPPGPPKGGKKSKGSRNQRVRFGFYKNVKNKGGRNQP